MSIVRTVSLSIENHVNYFVYFVFELHTGNVCNTAVGFIFAPCHLFLVSTVH